MRFVFTCSFRMPLLFRLCVWLRIEYDMRVASNDRRMEVYRCAHTVHPLSTDFMLRWLHFDMISFSLIIWDVVFERKNSNRKIQTDLKDKWVREQYG